MYRSSPSPSLWRALLGSALVIISLGGCKNEPDRDWANEAYAAQKPMIDEIQKELTAEFDRFAPVPYQEHPTDPQARAEFVAAQDARRDAFDAAATKILSKYDKVIGWEAAYIFPEHEKPPIRYTFEEFSTHTPVWKPGMVRADRREKMEDGRQLSWGELFIKGDEKRESMGMEIPNYHWGLEVELPIRHEAAALDFSLFIVPKRNDEE